ncbi:hypothetical protein OIV83_002202 [Microbotryomycetes sp. JL201]|nr:hypothetical protein OIV83_002202 [Microbotryomycetes sp. JL201]
MSAPKKPSQLSATNLGIGAAVSLFEVTTLGQPLEVLKTQMAANRQQNLRQAFQATMQRGGIPALWQGLIPWAWIERRTRIPSDADRKHRRWRLSLRSGTTGALLLFTSSAVESAATGAGLSAGTGGLLGGVLGGAAQAYGAMGVCTCMKTAEITRQKAALQTAVAAMPGQPPVEVKVPSTWAFFLDTYRREGIRGINKGVNAVALRQMTNWGSRMGFARMTENFIRSAKGVEQGSKLSGTDKVISSAVGGALGVWNHPIEVIRVEMQSMKKADASVKRPAKMSVWSTGKYIYQENGVSGLFRGVTPRVGLSVWRTICLVSLGDHVKEIFAARKR